jgi:hypothetical protein
MSRLPREKDGDVVLIDARRGGRAGVRDGGRRRSIIISYNYNWVLL